MRFFVRMYVLCFVASYAQIRIMTINRTATPIRERARERDRETETEREHLIADLLLPKKTGFRILHMSKVLLLLLLLLPLATLCCAVVDYDDDLFLDAADV
jgi:hypothetical protein